MDSGYTDSPHTLTIDQLPGSLFLFNGAYFHYLAESLAAHFTHGAEYVDMTTSATISLLLPASKTSSQPLYGDNMGTRVTATAARSRHIDLR